jgi:hypothetical protein
VVGRGVFWEDFFFLGVFGARRLVLFLEVIDGDGVREDEVEGSLNVAGDGSGARGNVGELGGDVGESLQW